MLGNSVENERVYGAVQQRVASIALAMRFVFCAQLADIAAL